MKTNVIIVLKKIRSILQMIHALLWCLLHGVKYRKGVCIGYNVKKKRRVKLVLSEYSRLSYNILLWGDGVIKIGAHSSIGSNSRIFASKDGGVTIGDNTMSASHLYIIDCNHGIDAGILIQKQPMTQAAVSIGSDVWLGYNTTVLMGVTLEDGVVCAACCCVTKSFPKNAVVGGVPAKIIKYRT